MLVSEVDDGYIARAFPGQAGNLKAEGIALPMSDVMALINSQEQGRGVPVNDVKMPPLCPTGYEDFFRSLGFDLDSVDSSNVCLVELSGGILVSYTTRAKSGVERAQMFYDPPRIDELLTKGYQRRGKLPRSRNARRRLAELPCAHAGTDCWSSWVVGRRRAPRPGAASPNTRSHIQDPRLAALSPDRTGTCGWQSTSETAWRESRIRSDRDFPIPTPRSHPQCLAIGPDWAIWFAEFGGNRIGRITRTGHDYRVPPASSK